MNIGEIASQIIEALTSGLGSLLRAVPMAIVEAFQYMFFKVTETTSNGVTTYEISDDLNGFGITILIFGGVSLAFLLTKLVYNLVRSKIG